MSVAHANVFDSSAVDDATPAEQRLLREVELLGAEIDAGAGEGALVDAVRGMCQGRKWQYGEIWLANEVGGELRRRAVWDSAAGGAALRAMPTSPDEFVNLALWKRAVCTYELELVTSSRAQAALALGFRRVVAVPLVVGAVALGVMVFLLEAGESLESGLGEQVVAVVLELDHAGRVRTRTAQAMFGWRRGEALRLDVARLATPIAAVEAVSVPVEAPSDIPRYDSVELRRMFDGALDALLMCDDDAHYVDANEAALQMLQVSREQLLAMRMHDIVEQTGEAAVEAVWAKFLRVGHVEGEFVFHGADGEARVAEYRGTANIVPGRHLSALRDVTEQRRAAGSRRRLAAIGASAAEAIDGTTLAGIIDYWSPAAERLYGYTADEVIGRSKAILLPADRADELTDLLARVRGGELVRAMETVRRRKDGSTFAASITACPICEAGEVVGVSAVTSDISEKKQLEARLAIADRMASVGTLAAGVAHEINNPLAALVANLDLLQLELAECANGTSEEISARLARSGPLLDDSREAADCIRVIVRDLKLFSRSDDARPSSVDIRRVIESSLRMADNEIRHRAALVRDFGEVPPVEGSDARLGQVMLNLVLNAAQSIRAGDAAGNEIRVVTSTDEAGRAVIEVSDTGSGIAAEHLAHVFEPFFTTKEVGIGTGLGLSISQRIVREMGGEIEARSTVGAGSTFRITLPPALVVTPRIESPRLRIAQPRRARVLVIDDEPMIARVVERILGGEHEMDAVTSASEALEKIAEGERYDVILCDVMMPQMTGVELHAALREVARDQAERMVFFTGGAFTARTREFIESTTNVCLEKPFHAEQLRALVQERLR